MGAPGPGGFIEFSRHMVMAELHLLEVCQGLVTVVVEAFDAFSAVIRSQLSLRSNRFSGLNLALFVHKVSCHGSSCSP